MSMCTIMNGIYLKVTEKLEACDVHVHHREENPKKRHAIFFMDSFS